LGATLRLPTAWFGVAIFFAYTGLELGTGTWAYTVLTEGRGIAMTTAGPWVTCFWVGLTTGRVLGAFALRTRPVATVLRATVTLLVASLALFAASLPAPSDLVALVLAGAAAGPIFPSLIATTPGRVGTRHGANAIGMQIAAAALGQALVPSLLGAIGRRHGLDALTLALPALALVVAVLVALVQRTPAARTQLAPAAR
jgi:fucose permease